MKSKSTNTLSAGSDDGNITIRTAFASQAPPAAAQPPAHKQRTSAPSTAADHKSQEERDKLEAAMAAERSGATFGGLSKPFLAAVQRALEDAGCDLTSAAALQALVNDASLPGSLGPALVAAAAATGIRDVNTLVEMVRQWQQALRQQMEEQQEQERKAREKKQRPVWRCAACGR